MALNVNLAQMWGLMNLIVWVSTRFQGGKDAGKVMGLAAYADRKKEI
ncbi:MAG: hypothetical protein CM15mV127_420 [Caudoviricetes sp.]|nr:MAG: hypothetical protein CM15mV127_420 [Caudoviricetes sp.]